MAFYGLAKYQANSAAYDASLMIDTPLTIDNAGNPPHLVKLQDGRLALTYGYRHAPYGIRAKISSDGGKTWSDEIILRDDGDSWDLGYPRTIQRIDGKMVTVYYFNDKSDKIRHIAATLWELPER